jgi:TonB family protein
MSTFNVNNTPDEKGFSKRKSLFNRISLQSILLGLALVGFASVIAFKVLVRFKTDDFVKPEKVVECQTVLPDFVAQVTGQAEIEAQTKIEETKKVPIIQNLDKNQGLKTDSSKAVSTPRNRNEKAAICFGRMSHAAFPGGQKALDKFLETNVRYPVGQQEKDLRRAILVGFTVEVDGSITNAHLKFGPDKGGKAFTDEAIRVVESMPKWTPGTKNGNVYSTNRQVVVRFVLNSISSKLSVHLDSVNQLEKQMEVFNNPETSPEFPGGQAALFLFIKENLKYPDDRCVEGTVTVGFVIEEDGTVSNVHIKRGLQGLENYNNEALRVVSLIPKWKPGKQEGRAVRVNQTLPVRFKIEKQEEEN